jgi:hypothetical protein
MGDVMTDIWSHASGMADREQVLHRNLHEVWAEGDTGRRWKAIERTYGEVVKFIDPEGEVVGRQALSERAQKILDTAPDDFVFEEDSPPYAGINSAALAWRFGPSGNRMVPRDRCSSRSAMAA